MCQEKYEKKRKKRHHRNGPCMPLFDLDCTQIDYHCVTVSLFCVLCDWIGLLSLFALLCAHRLPIALRRDQRMCFSFSVQKNIPPMGCRFDFFNILRLHLCFFLFVRMHLFHQSRPLFLCTSSVVIQLVYIGVYTSFPLPRMYRRNG